MAELTGTKQGFKFRLNIVMVTLAGLFGMIIWYQETHRWIFAMFFGFLGTALMALPFIALASSNLTIRPIAFLNRPILFKGYGYKEKVLEQTIIATVLVGPLVVYFSKLDHDWFFSICALFVAVFTFLFVSAVGNSSLPRLINELIDGIIEALLSLIFLVIKIGLVLGSILVPVYLLVKFIKWAWLN